VSKRNGPRKFKATFENGGFWEYYKDLERQFEDFLEYVPYIDKNESVCSFRLVNLILSIGGHVDSAFKRMAFYRGFNRGHEEIKRIREKVKRSRESIKRGGPPIMVSFRENFQAFEEEYGISKEKIIFKRLPMRELVQPFKPHNPVTNAPKWWIVYNGAKHDFAESFERASLSMAKDALAGAMLLNIRHTPGVRRLFDSGLLRVAWADKFQGEPACECMKWKIAKTCLGENSPFFVETPIFRYNYGKG